LRAERPINKHERGGPATAVTYPRSPVALSATMFGIGVVEAERLSVLIPR
jgi:hypothetical protein